MAGNRNVAYSPIKDSYQEIKTPFKEQLLNQIKGYLDRNMRNLFFSPAAKQQAIHYMNSILPLPESTLMLKLYQDIIRDNEADVVRLNDQFRHFLKKVIGTFLECKPTSSNSITKGLCLYLEITQAQLFAEADAIRANDPRTFLTFKEFKQIAAQCLVIRKLSLLASKEENPCYLMRRNS